MAEAEGILGLGDRQLRKGQRVLRDNRISGHHVQLVKSRCGLPDDAGADVNEYKAKIKARIKPEEVGITPDQFDAWIQEIVKAIQQLAPVIQALFGSCPAPAPAN
jgi:hypothetical protein